MTRGVPFEPGNKFGRGRPKGSRNKSTSVVHRRLEENAEPLIVRHISSGLRDSVKSRQWCLDRIWEGQRSTSKLKLPRIRTVDDITLAYGVILTAVANHKRTAADGQALCAILGEIRTTMENQVLVHRLDEVERLQKVTG